jgi:predicted nucleic acid-binding protein
VFPCAARNAVAARLAQDPEGFAASGVGSLSDALADRIAAGAERDLVASVASGAARVADAALERVRLTRAAVTAVIENRGRDVELFSEEVGRSEQMLTEALASISWETREVRRRLDTAAGEHSRRTRLELLARLDGLSATIADEPAVRRARQMVVTVIEHDVEAWRGDQLAGFDQGMSTLVSRQQERLDRVADGVRDAAQRLLGLELRPVIEQLSVPDVGGFRFDFTPAVGWNTAVVEGVRRHLPGRWRRSAVAAHLRTETLTLVDRQYGRARADLQVRLEAAHQQLARELTSRVTEQRDALTAALAAATDLQAGTSEQQQRHVDALAARIDALQRLGLRMRQQSGETPAVEPAPQDEARDTQDDSGRPQGRA